MAVDNRREPFLHSAACSAGFPGSSNPVLTGIIALMLERNPALDTPTIKSILQSTARRDAFTGPDANTRGGYGKVDALAAIDRVAGTAPRPLARLTLNGESFRSGQTLTVGVEVRNPPWQSTRRPPHRGAAPRRADSRRAVGRRNPRGGGRACLSIAPPANGRRATWLQPASSKLFQPYASSESSGGHILDIRGAGPEGSPSRMTGSTPGTSSPSR